MLTPLISAFCWSISTAGLAASGSVVISIGVTTCVWLLLFFTISQLLLLLLIATDVGLPLKFSCWCCWLKLQFSTLWFPHDEDDGDMAVACSIIDAVSHVNESHPRFCSCASFSLVLLLLLLLPFFCVDRACISHFCSCLISSWWSYESEDNMKSMFAVYLSGKIP